MKKTLQQIRRASGLRRDVFCKMCGLTIYGLKNHETKALHGTETPKEIIELATSIANDIREIMFKYEVPEEKN